MPAPIEAISISIDLESSLGRIDDIEMDDSNHEDAMQCEQTARTSSIFPFKEDETSKKDQQQHVISPYPLSETECEIVERRRLGRRLSDCISRTLPVGISAENQQTIPQATTADTEWAELELIPDDNADRDDFSLSSEGSESLKEEDIELEKIDDPVSFWDTDVPTTSEHPTVIPPGVSFTSGCDAKNDKSQVDAMMRCNE